MNHKKSKTIYKIAAVLMLFALFIGLIFSLVAGIQSYQSQKAQEQQLEQYYNSSS